MTCSTWLMPLATRLGVADEMIGEGAPDGDPTLHEAADGPMLRAALDGAAAPDAIVVLRVPEAEVAEAVVGTGARLVVAYRHESVSATDRFPTFSFGDHILVRWERLLSAFGISTRRADLHLDTSALPRGRPLATVIHPGASSPARRWPAARWSEVARALEASGHRVVLSGSRSERAIAEAVRIEAGLAPERNLAGSTGILELAGLIVGARLVLSCDTGVSHLAVALRRRSVTLFGAVPPDWWGAPPGCSLHRALWKGRVGEPYAPEPDPGLLEIEAREVVAAATDSSWPDDASYCCPFLSEPRGSGARGA